MSHFPSPAAAGDGEVSAARVLAPGGTWDGPAVVRFADGRVSEVARGGRARGTLTPGLIDLHNNGAFGVDFATAGLSEWREVLSRLAACGVTAVQPTIITAPLPAIFAAMDRAALARDALAGEPVARILGLHMEGPFLSRDRRGAHRADWLLDPSPEAIGLILQHHAARRVLRTVTLAPELPQALGAIRRLVDAGIVAALGHSDASLDQAEAAALAGATMATHVFNAMAPFNHRAPGLAGSALTDPRLTCCLIVDGGHVSGPACHVAFAAAGERLVAVSDSILVAGLPPGSQHSFGGMPVVVDGDGIGRRPDGRIAGGGITLSEGVRRMIAIGIDPARVLHAATGAPARAIQRSDIGRIVPGARADLVWWDEDWIPRRVWLGGMEMACG